MLFHKFLFLFFTACLGLIFCPINPPYSIAAQVTDKPSAAVSAPQSDNQPKTIAPEALFATLLVNAEKGQPQAMLNVGTLYEQGIGVPRNFTKALEWYEKSAQAGEKEGYTRQGLCYEVGMGASADMAKAVINFTKASDMGSAQATHKLASLYFMGRGLPKDDSKGFALLSRAAETDSASANELAVIYLRGLFSQKEDPVKARDWFTKSAELGNLEGIKNLAVMLKDGIGQKPEPEAALRWFIIAQKGGLSSDELDEIIKGLKKNLKDVQVKKAEKDAEQWIAAYTTRMKPE
jgi:TPR repeat protein